MKREWSCNPTAEGGYHLELKSGDSRFYVIITSAMIDKTFDTQKYIEYHIIRLNEKLRSLILPLARNDEELRRHYYVNRR